MLLPVSCCLLQLATTCRHSVNYATSVLDLWFFWGSLSVVQPSGWTHHVVCWKMSLLPWRGRQKFPPEYLCRLFAVWWHWAVHGLIHRKYIDGGQVGYKQSYSVSLCIVTIDRTKISKSTVLHRMLSVLWQETVEVLAVLDRKRHVTWRGAHQKGP